MKKLPVRQRARSAETSCPVSLLHHNLQLVTTYLPIDELKPPRRQLRKHGKRQLSALKASVSEFGILKPILINAEGQIVAGYGVWLAAKELNLTEVPVISITHLSEEQLRLYAIADNQIPTLETFDEAALRLEIGELADLDLKLNLDLNFEAIGFATSQIDDLLARDAQAESEGEGDEDDCLEVPGEPVTRLGDLWLCGNHKLLCGNALEAQSYATLLGEERAQLVVVDSPFNVPINGHVSSTGRHPEFQMASGEMSEAEFTDFLTTAFGHLATYSVDGSIHFQFIDWRHLGEMLAAGRTVYSELKNLLVWNKGTGGMGTFYRSQHELIFAWKRGTAPHINNFGLGDTGRYRTNVLDYKGCAGFRKGRDEDLAAHSTVKNTSLIADLIRDCSKRGGIVLDCFGGSGTAMLAAALAGRRARLIELEPRYCDVAIRRWEKITGEEAVLAATGQTFHQLEAERLGGTEEA